MKRDPKYLALVRQMPCCACEALPPSDPAHIRKGSNAGMGQKPPDDRVVPLCRACHSKQHSIGELRFWYPFGGHEFAAVFAKKLYRLRDLEQEMLLEIIEFRGEKNVQDSE